MYPGSVGLEGRGFTHNGTTYLHRSVPPNELHISTGPYLLINYISPQVRTS